MHSKFDKFLLSLLWILAAAIAATLWFQFRFGFDVTARNHWRYLAESQAGGAPVNGWFYASLVVIALITILGLYLIMRPWRKRIKVNSPQPAAVGANGIRPDQQPSMGVDNAVYIPMDRVLKPAPPPGGFASGATPTIEIPRPPRIQASAATLANNYPAAGYTPPSAKPMAVNSQQGAVYEPKSEIRNQKSEIPDISPESQSRIDAAIERAGFQNRPKPNINGYKTNIWAAGGEELLLVGRAYPLSGEIIANEGGTSQWKWSGGEFDSPVWKTVDATEKLNKLFTDTLDNSITINIRPFVIIDGGAISNYERFAPVWDAFGVRVFQSIEEFETFMSDMPAPDIASDEADDFKAYLEYIDVVADHFNKT